MAKHPNAIDVQVGKRVRARRNLLLMSQESLADKLGLTFQQVQKYEKGTNRMGTSRLVQIAEALNCEPADLLSGLTTKPEVAHKKSNNHLSMDEVDTFMSTTQGVVIVRGFLSISNRAHRAAIVAMVKQLAK